MGRPHSIDHDTVQPQEDESGGPGGTLVSIEERLRLQDARAGGPSPVGTQIQEIPAALGAEWSEQWGRGAVATLLNADAAFDGLFCFSDQIPRGALDALRENGVDVPGAVGVVGVDNWAVMAEAARPALTTVDLNLHSIGRTAASWLLSVIAGDPPHSGVELAHCELVRRAST